MKSFTTEYKKLGKHRKKCLVCGKLIQDGETVYAEQVKSEKYYPVKGIMKFATWRFSHVVCKERQAIGTDIGIFLIGQKK